MFVAKSGSTPKSRSQHDSIAASSQAPAKSYPNLTRSRFWKHLRAWHRKPFTPLQQNQLQKQAGEALSNAWNRFASNVQEMLEAISMAPDLEDVLNPPLPRGQESQHAISCPTSMGRLYQRPTGPSTRAQCLIHSG